jgi:preprotein translocase subunit SecG
MNTIFTVVIVIQVISALTIIGLVLLQHGKGADMGAAFGSGASGSLFGATGSSNFLSKSTGFAAAVFFAATLALAYMGNKHSTLTGGVMDSISPSSLIAPPATSTAPGNNTSAPAQPASPASQSQGQSNQIPK